MFSSRLALTLRNRNSSHEMLLFILSSERYNDRARERTISEIGRRGVMTGHGRREWQLLPLDSIPGGNRDIGNVPSSHRLAPELRGPWDSGILPNP
jgi:hypothetical protein